MKEIHKEICETPFSTHEFIGRFIAELKDLSKPSAGGGVQVCVPNYSRTWIPPPTVVAKLNVDAAVSKNGNQRVVTLLCRDSNGVYEVTSIVIFSGIADPTVLEALSCHEVLVLAGNLNLSRILIASDCKIVVTDISDRIMGRYGTVISEIKSQSAPLSECRIVLKAGLRI
jgi:hypothetical protein